MWLPVPHLYCNWQHRAATENLREMQVNQDKNTTMPVVLGISFAYFTLSYLICFLNICLSKIIIKIELLGFGIDSVLSKKLYGFLLGK